MIKNHKNSIGAGILSLALALVGATSSQAVITVVDNFNDGVLAPAIAGAGYTFINAPGSSALVPEGTMAEVASSGSVHPLWNSPTTLAGVTGDPGGRFLAVNGSKVSGGLVWQKTVPVAINTTYFFEGWLATLFNANQADLQFRVEFLDGSNTVVATSNGVVTSPAGVGSWNLYSLTAINTTGVNARLSLLNAETAANGNDFGVDYLTFDTERQIPVVPEVSTGVSAGAFALLGGLVVLRRRKAAQVA